MYHDSITRRRRVSVAPPESDSFRFTPDRGENRIRFKHSIPTVESPASSLRSIPSLALLPHPVATLVFGDLTCLQLAQKRGA
ncbi:hypothetical protein VTL71DRAFT_294, partial [Oculimacula yallundae]